MTDETTDTAAVLTTNEAAPYDPSAEPMELDGSAEDADAPVDYAAVAMQVVQAMRDTMDRADPPTRVLVNPQYAAGFREAWSALPDEVVSEPIRQQFPIEETDAVESLHLETFRQVEEAFLLQHFGPRERGGNGLLPALQQHLQGGRIPVMPTTQDLRVLYLANLERLVCPRVAPIRAAELEINPRIIR